jgi:DNA-binding LacI/PurR family transcriptional regulator
MHRCTLKDLSKETGYAISTISNVLNDRDSCFASKATREKIKEAAERLGYRADHVARSLRSGETRIVGVACRLFASEVQSEQLNALQRALREEGYIATFIDMKEDLVQTLEEVRIIRADALIIFSSWNETKAAQKITAEVPAIGIGPERMIGIPTVIVDRTEATKIAVRHLADLGHQRIAFVTRKPKGNLSKLRGYLEGMREVGLDDYIKVIPVPEIIGAILPFVREHQEEFRSATAIVTNGDQVAAELLPGLTDVGIRVPRDCSLVGFNDVRIAKGVSPQLTTLRQPREELAKGAVQMMMALIRGKSVRNRRLVPELVVRDSTCPPDGKTVRKKAAKA